MKETKYACITIIYTLSGILLLTGLATGNIPFSIIGFLCICVDIYARYAEKKYDENKMKKRNMKSIEAQVDSEYLDIRIRASEMFDEYSKEN